MTNQIKTRACDIPEKDHILGDDFHVPLVKKSLFEIFNKEVRKAIMDCISSTRQDSKRIAIQQVGILIDPLEGRRKKNFYDAFAGWAVKGLR